MYLSSLQYYARGAPDHGGGPRLAHYMKLPMGVEVRPPWAHGWLGCAFGQLGVGVHFPLKPSIRELRSATPHTVLDQTVPTRSRSRTTRKIDGNKKLKAITLGFPQKIWIFENRHFCSKVETVLSLVLDLVLVLDVLLVLDLVLILLLLVLALVLGLDVLLVLDLLLVLLLLNLVLDLVLLLAIIDFGFGYLTDRYYTWLNMYFSDTTKIGIFPKSRWQ